MLLARRLIEAGSRVACISWAPDANATWDTHGNNFARLKQELLPQLDAAVSALLDDLVVRGMFERTLVVVMGEFGRSPRINNGAGRDHWNSCYGLMMAGGGIKGGHVFGESDRTGSLPLSRAVTPADVVATIYHTLGIAKDFELHDNLGRPFPVVPAGDVIADILTAAPNSARRDGSTGDEPMCMTPLGERNLQPELMDAPDLDPQSHAQALVALRRVNVLSRTAAVVWSAIRPLARSQPDRPLRVLDVASGGGDVTLGIWRRASARVYPSKSWAWT